MNFGLALQRLREGHRVHRRGWNGRGMWLEYVTSGSFVRSTDGEQVMLLPFIVMKTVQGEHVPWLASQTDVLAEDWDYSAE